MKKGKTKVWSFAGGKGGSGKSFLAAHFAIALEKLGYRVLVLDLDFCGSNIHTFLGLRKYNHTLNDFFISENQSSFESFLSPTDFPKLMCMPGETRRFFDSRTATKWDLELLLKTARESSFDFVLIDLGTGTNPEKLQVLTKSDERFVVTQPDPVSIEKTYRFYEAYLQSLMGIQTSDYYAVWRKYESQRKASFSINLNLKNMIEKEFPEIHQGLIEKGDRSLRLIINSSRSHSDQSLGPSIQSVSYKFYGWAFNYTGCVDFDNAVWQSARAMKPLWIEHPHSPVLGQIMSIAKIFHFKQVQESQILRSAG
ncbi:MAG: MinD/ParA family protein [Pseudobdellovibrionaceae bacterium]